MEQTAEKTPVALDKIVELSLRRGFIFPGSEIYGGLRNSWDYGPLGTQLKNNLRDAWWRHYVTSRSDMYGLDAAILMNPKIWEASGHVAGFTDPMIECKKCHGRWRADDLIQQTSPDTATEGVPLAELTRFFQEDEVKCPSCGKNDWTDVRSFNLLFETSLGTVEGQKQRIYLRGELAQAMFVDFKRVVETMHPALPFGIAQVGRVFRNEISPGNFTYRTLEFDLMEFEYFTRPEAWEKKFDEWQADMMKWATETLGLCAESLRWREQEPNERAFYSKKTCDLEFLTSFGWKELFAVAARTDYDLKRHSEASGVDLRLTDNGTGEKFFPYVIEPTFGLSRLTLFTLLNAYHEEEVRGEKRVVMRFKPTLAPYQVAVLPLSKKPELNVVAEPLAQELSQSFSCDYDVTQSIGRRYRRQDEIGTPLCVTVDFDSLNDRAATVRDRDTMEQERIPIAKIKTYLEEKLNNNLKFVI